MEPIPTLGLRGAIPIDLTTQHIVLNSLNQKGSSWFDVFAEQSIVQLLQNGRKGLKITN